MLEWPSLILGLLPIAEDAFVPGKFKELRSRFTCHSLFHDIRKNHHLKRALRLSWISAAHAIINACKNDMEECPDVELRDGFNRYLPVFAGAMNQAVKEACDLSSKHDLPDSPIDDFIYHFVEGMPGHLAFDAAHKYKQDVTDRFLNDLRNITCAPDKVPQAVVLRARMGVSTGTDRPRTFGTLMFDDFARVLQDPAAYPEANASFLQLQFEVHMELSRENLLVSRRIAAAVAGLDERLDQLLQHNPSAWLQRLVTERLDVILGNSETIIRMLRKLLDEERNRPRLSGQFDEASQRPMPPATDVTGWHDPLEQASPSDKTLLIHYCLSEDPGRFREIKKTFQRVLENMKAGNPVDLLPWHVPSIEYREQHTSRYFQKTLSARHGDQHCATFIELGTSLGASVACEQSFADRLDALQWLNDDAPGVDIDLPGDLGKRSKAARRGVFPLTVESHLALAAAMQRKHLHLLLRVDRKEVSRPVECFLTFMETLGASVESADVLHKDKTWVLRYLQTLLGITPRYIENPYPRLEHYTLEDAGHYRGREAECDDALALIDQRHANGQPTVLGVRGPSGCGKSSFVHARLAAALAHKGCKTLILRRTDFLDADGETVKAAQRLTERICLTLGQSENNDVTPLFDGQPAFVVPSCRHYLDKQLKKSGGPRMVICLDQFEEIVDDLADGKSVAEWTSLLGIVDHLATEHQISIVFTLEDSRFEKLAAAVRGSVMSEPTWLQLDDGRPAFLRTVVQAPLRDAGFELDEDIVTRLVNEAIELDQSNGDIGSALPLLSLKMHNLFREIRAQGMDGNIDAPTRIDAQTLDRLSLSIADEIEALAETAWRRAEADDSDLGHFLRPLVRLSRSTVENTRPSIVLGTLKTRGFANEQRIDEEFSKLRLLVPAAGGWRLVHESVVHRWKRSAKWLAATQDEPASEAELRKEAEAWHEQGRPVLAAVAPDTLDAAIQVLTAQIRNWVTDLHNLPDDERQLRDYALALFDTSETPLKPVPNNERLHVHLAASYGRVDLLRRYTRLDSSSVHALTADHRSPLHSSAFSQAEATAYLLAQNADVHQCMDGGATALDIATFVQRDDILDLLLEAVRTSAKDTLPGTPLLSAAATGNLAMAKKLEVAGYAHDTVNDQGWTPLHCAATNDHLDAFRYFLSRGNLETESKSACTAIDVAAANGHWRLIQAAFSHEATGRILAGKRSNGWTTLALAAERKRYKTVEMLAPICDPNATVDEAGAYEGYTALHLALYEYDLDRENASQHLRNQTIRTAEALLSSARTDVLLRAKGKNAYEMATGLPTLQAAILAHPNYDPLRPMDNGWSELMLAAKSGDRERVTTLFGHIKHREDIDHISDDGTSLALLLLQAGMPDFVQPLLEAGDVDPWKAANGYPGLLIAADTPATQDLFQRILAAMPERLQPATTARILMDIITRDVAKETDAALTLQVLKRTDLSDDTQALSSTMISAVQFGRFEIFRVLEQHDVKPVLPDEWGRQIEDLASDLVREALLNRRRLLS